MTQKVVIFGCSELAQLAKVYLDADHRYQVVAFCVDQAFYSASTFMGVEVAPYEQLAERFPPDQVGILVAIGYNNVNRDRAAVYQRVRTDGYRCLSFVGNGVVTTDEVAVGDNCVVFDGAILQPFAHIGNDVVIWNGANIGHHTTVGDHCFIAPEAAIAGNVTIHPYCFIGINATIRDGVIIAPSCVIGAGAIIKHDTIENGVYMGTESIVAATPSDRLKHI